MKYKTEIQAENSHFEYGFFLTNCFFFYVFSFIWFRLYDSLALNIDFRIQKGDYRSYKFTNGILLTTTPIGRNLFKIKQIRNMVFLKYKYIRFNLVFARWYFNSDGPQKMMQLAVQFNYCLNAHVIFYCNLL